MRTSVILRYSLLITLIGLMLSCIDTKQEFYLNTDGSGKLKITAEMPIKAKMQMQSGSKKDSLTYEDRKEMAKKVRKILSGSEGIEAWKDVSYKSTGDGMMHFSGTAYFPDASELQIEDIPVIPFKEVNGERVSWRFKEMDKMKQPEKRGEDLSEKEVEELVDKLQKGYKQSAMMMKMVMSNFNLEATYHLPGKIKDLKGLEEQGDRKVYFNLAGNSMYDNFEKLMEDGERVRNLVVNKGVRKFDYENQAIFNAAYPGKEFMYVEFRTGLFATDPENRFNYAEEVKAIDPKIPEIPMPEKPEPRYVVYNTMPQKANVYWQIKAAGSGRDVMEGDHLVAFNNSNDNNRIQVYDILNKKRKKELPLSVDETWGAMVCGNPEEKFYLYSAQDGNKGNAVMINGWNKNEVQRWELPANPWNATWIDNQRAAIALSNGKLVALDVESGNMQSFWMTKNNKASGFNPSVLDTLRQDEKLHLITLEKATGTMKIWNTKTWEAKEKALKNPGLMNGMWTAPGNGYFAVLNNKSIDIYKGTEHYHRIEDIKNATCKEIAWNPDGTLLYFASPKNKLQAFDVQKREVSEPLGITTHQYIKLTANGEYLITGNPERSGHYKVYQLKFNE